MESLRRRIAKVPKLKEVNGSFEDPADDINPFFIRFGLFLVILLSVAIPLIIFYCVKTIVVLETSNELLYMQVCSP
jgi:hypothetical protein